MNEDGYSGVHLVGAHQSMAGHNKQHAMKTYDRYLTEVVEPLVGSGITTDHVLISAGNRLLGPKFAGVFASDQMEPPSTNPTYMIVNTDKHTGPGVHWTAVCVNDDVLYFYDSFGRSAESIMPSLIEYAHKHDLRLVAQKNEPEQAHAQKDCGARCLAWLLLAKRNGIRVAARLIT